MCFPPPSPLPYLCRADSDTSRFCKAQWDLLHNREVLLFTRGLVGWNELYKTQRMDYYYINLQLFIAGISASPVPATSLRGQHHIPMALAARGRAKVEAVGLCELRQCPPHLWWIPSHWHWPSLLFCFTGMLTDRVPCMEKGSRANHVTPLNDTSWSAHHPLWLKVKQIKQLPITTSLRGSLSPTGAFDPEDSTSWTHTVCSAFLRPPPLLLQGTLSPLGFLLRGFFTLVSKTTWTNIGTFSLPDFKVQIFETGQWYGFFFFFSKNCCGFAATLRIVICIVWFWTYSSFDGGKG